MAWTSWISQSNRSKSHSPWGWAETNQTGGNGCHPPVRNRLSYTRTAPALQAQRWFYDFFPLISVQIFTCTVSFRRIDPTTKVMAATTIGYHKPAFILPVAAHTESPNS